jgi:hypothetical protein
MKAIFKYGDRVLAGKHPGTVVSITKQATGYYCRVRFDDKKLIPSEMTYEQDNLKFLEFNENACPMCGSQWKVTEFMKKIWKDCKSCNDTKENLQEKYNKLNPQLSKNYTDEQDSLLEEFERMLKDI